MARISRVMKRLALMSVVAVISFGVVGCGGSSESTATVCANLDKDGSTFNNEAKDAFQNAGSSPEGLAAAQTPLDDLANVLIKDGGKASDSALKTATANLATAAKKLGADLAAGNTSSYEADANAVAKDSRTLNTFCPNLAEEVHKRSASLARR